MMRGTVRITFYSNFMLALDPFIQALRHFDIIVLDNVVELSRWADIMTSSSHDTRFPKALCSTEVLVQRV